MSDDLVIREQSTGVLFSVGPDGAVTHVDEAILDEVVAVLVAAVLWGRLGDAARSWATLEEDKQDVLHAIAQEALTPLLRRLAQAR